MNRAYRLVWNEMREMLVAVAENSRARGKKTGERLLPALLVAAFLGLPLAGGEAWGRMPHVPVEWQAQRRIKIRWLVE